MNPYLKFKKCLRISKHSFDFIDKDVFQLHWKMSIGFVIYSLLFLVAIYSAIYTVANYDGDIAFNALVIFTGLSQNFLKYLFAWDLRFLAEILEYIAIVYQINSDHGAHHYMLCKKFANYSQLIIITVPAAYFIAVTLVGCVSLYEFVITGILKAPYSLYFPDIYGETSSNAEIPLFVTNIAFIAVCMAIVFSYDSLILMTFCNVLLLSAIIVRELNDFQSILVDENIAEIEIRHRLLKIICMQKKYKEIIEKLDEGFGRASAIQIVTASLFTSVAVFIAVQEHVFGAFVVIAIGCAQILLFCFYGMIIELSSCRISDAVLSLDWFMLPKEEKKIYLIFLPYVQEMQIIYIAKVWPLNMERSLTIFKTIYSYAMLLQQMTA